MEWVLLWVILSPTGGVSSGSAQFENEKACFQGQRALGTILSDAERMRPFDPRESICVNVETGERKTAIASVEDAQKAMQKR